MIDSTGKIIKNDPLSQKIFNDNFLDFGILSNMVGVEFEEPVSVDVIKYITQNDKNGIYPGNIYELMYFDQGRWVSLGSKMATADYIEYEMYLRTHYIGCAIELKVKKSDHLQ